MLALRLRKPGGLSTTNLMLFTGLTMANGNFCQPTILNQVSIDVTDDYDKLPESVKAEVSKDEFLWMESEGRERLLDHFLVLDVEDD